MSEDTSIAQISGAARSHISHRGGSHLLVHQLSTGPVLVLDECHAILTLLWLVRILLLTPIKILLLTLLWLVSMRDMLSQTKNEKIHRGLGG